MNLAIFNAIVHAEHLARNCVPELEGRPLYVVQPARGTMIPPGMIDAFGMYDRGLDLALQPQLEMEGRWQGRGVCIIVDAFLCFAVANDDACGARHVLGAVLHELAHWLDMGEATEVAADHYEKLVAGCEAHKAQKQEPAPCESRLFTPVAIWHGEEFTRLCCHLWHRAGHGGGCPLRPECLAFGSDYPGLEYLHRPLAYIESLGDELERCQSMPLRGVLEMEKPLEYVALWRRTIKEMILAEQVAA
jgi:hypothetical protein